MVTPYVFILTTSSLCFSTDTIRYIYFFKLNVKPVDERNVQSEGKKKTVFNVIRTRAFQTSRCMQSHSALRHYATKTFGEQVGRSVLF